MVSFSSKAMRFSNSDKLKSFIGLSISISSLFILNFIDLHILVFLIIVIAIVVMVLPEQMAGNAEIRVEFTPEQINYCTKHATLWFLPNQDIVEVKVTEPKKFLWLTFGTPELLFLTKTDSYAIPIYPDTFEPQDIEEMVAQAYRLIQ